MMLLRILSDLSDPISPEQTTNAVLLKTNKPQSQLLSLLKAQIFIYVFLLTHKKIQAKIDKQINCFRILVFFAGVEKSFNQ